ncbi:MAG: TldD/PmbA family protein [archaeon]|nr:TldD/PmbA family protein [archaeon]
MNGYIGDRAMQALKDYDQAEVYVSDTTINTIYIDNSQISNIETKHDVGMMFRMNKDGRMGKAYLNLNGRDSEEECIRMADTVMRFSPVTEDIKPFAQPEQARIAMPDVFDRKIEEITPEVLRDLAKRLIGASAECNGSEVRIPRAQIRVSTTRSRTLNSNGVDIEHESTLLYGHFTSMCVRDHPGEGIEEFRSTHLDIEPERIGRSIAEKAYNAATCTEFKGHLKCPMVLTPGEGADMFFSVVGDAIDGENQKYGRSHWQNSVDQPVASEILNVVDDPTGTAPLAGRFDDEGVATQRRSIIENGVFKGFLRDTFCGDSTGNGLRRSSTEQQGVYARTPTIKPLNLRVSPGKYSLDQMIEQLDDAILVEKFAAPEAEGITGRFGLNVRCGHVIHKGEVVGVVNNALLMGNMYDCLQNIRMIGNDSTQGGVVNLPTICYDGTEIIGN